MDARRAIQPEHRPEPIDLGAAQAAQMPKPVFTSDLPFDKWIRAQVHRHDRVGALARVIVQDPSWPTGKGRTQVREYFLKMGAREFVLQSVKHAWDDFEKHQRVTRSKARRKPERQARKKQQQVNRRRKPKKR